MGVVEKSWADEWMIICFKFITGTKAVKRRSIENNAIIQILDE